MELGRHLEWAQSAQKIATISSRVVQISQPFPDAMPFTPSAPDTSHWLFIALCFVWACGFGAIVLMRLRAWLRIRAAVGLSTPTDIPGEVPIRSSPGLLEPGVVGFIRPVVLMPAGIVERLTPSQLEAVLSHELCHVRRHDNVCAAIHMIVEALFWFHPMVWWMGARLVEERERACDEEVLQQGSEPHIYAQAILDVCKHYIESPLVCTAGIGGADLKRRIEGIMAQRIGERLGTAKKVLLAAAGALAVVGPIAIGLLNAPPGIAQTPETFEVASIRPSDPSRYGHSGIGFSHGNFTAESVTIKSLIEAAYDVHPFQISSRSKLIDAEQYDVKAKADHSLDINPQNTTEPELKALLEQKRLTQLRLQALLADRFKLKLHRTSKEMHIFALVTSTGGPKFALAKNAGDLSLSGVHVGDGKLKATNIPMSFLANTLSNRVDSIVLDKTGLTGRYDLQMSWSPEELNRQGSVPVGPSLFAALQEQLGLKLVSQKGPVEMLVVDHVEKPSPN